MRTMASEPTNDVNAHESVLAAELIEGGSDLAGATAGAAIGLLGGPAGALGGAAAGVVVTRVLKRVGADIKQRILGPREEVRIGAATAYATVAIDGALRSGEIPRQDGFFEPNEDGDRPAAEEVLEGVLIRARDSYEEKKVPLLGIFYASIAFQEAISPAHANHLLELATRLTYRQLVVLAIALDESGRARLRPSDYRNDQEALERLGVDGRSLITEIYGLYQQGLLSDAGGAAWISVADVNPRAMRPQGSGHVLAIAMKLEATVPQEDREPVYRLLSLDPPFRLDGERGVG
jgi:hypothetical protein